MAYVQYSIKYGGVLRFAGNKANSIQVKYPADTTRMTIASALTKNVPCSNKEMKGNLVVGDKVIPCSDHIMSGNIDIEAKLVAGSNYDIVNTSGNWTVPPGVTRITAFLVGGGGAGGLSGGYVTHGEFPIGAYSRGQAGGGAGGKTNKVELDVTPGETIACEIGAGGAAGALKDGQSYDSTAERYRYYGSVVSGGSGGTTRIKRGSQVLASAEGGGAGGTARLTSNTTGGGTNGGSGGSGGAGGADCVKDDRSASGGNGGTNGGNGGTASRSPSSAGHGQGTSTTFNGITYAGGGGAGDNASIMDSRYSYGSTTSGNGGASGGANGGNNAGTDGYGGGGGGYSQFPGSSPSFAASNRGGSGIIIFMW